MNDNTPIRYSDLIAPDDSIIVLQKQLEDLAAEYKVLMDSIKAQTNSVKASLSSISGATSQGQQAIKNASAIVTKLAKKEAELSQTRSETAKKLAIVSSEVNKNNNLNRLQAKLAKSVAGSYDALSAQYSINKMQLNAMSTEERKNTKAGQDLERETEALYQQMKKLQESTGKHVLSVGDYGIAAATMASDIRNGIQALTQMRMEMKLLEEEGQKGSERWNELSENSQKLANDLKGLKREYQITKLETNALGQQTRGLNDAIGVLSVGSGSLSALTGTMNLFGGSAAGAAEALVQLNSVMAIANGISQAWNGIYKSGNLLLAVRTLQTKAATVAQNLQTKSTIAAKIAQAALNVVASANPYAALALAIAAVVGVVVAWVSSNARLIKEQKLLNQQTAATLEYMEAYNTQATRVYKENQTALEQELAIARARKASYNETQRLENQIQAQKKRSNLVSREYYKEEIKNLETNRTELARLRGELLKAQSVRGNKRVEIQLDAEGPARRIKASKIIDIIQDKINNLNKKVEIATELTYDQKEIEADAARLREEHKQQMLEVAAMEREALRGAEDAQNALLTHRFIRQRAIEKANTARQITDLKVRLQTESNLTVRARQAINSQIVALQKKLVQTLRNINEDEQAANLEAVRNLENTAMEARQESADKQRDLLKMSYDREVEDVKTRLATEEDLTETEQEALIQKLTVLWAKYQKDRFELENKIRQEQLGKESQSLENQLVLVSENTSEALNLRLQALDKRRQAELEANKALAIDMRQDEAAINAKYDQLALEERIKSENEIAKAKLDTEQAYDESVFNLREHSEREITKFQLMQQKARIEAEIKAQTALLAIQTGEQKEMTLQVIETLKNQLAALNKEIDTLGVNNIYELLGFDISKKQQSALNAAFSSIMDNLSSLVDSWNEAAQAAVDAADKQVEAAQRILDAEVEARNAGYANSVATAQKELMLAQRKREEAQREQRKAQRAQLALDSVTQASSLVTASANLWASFSKVGGIFGPALAIAAMTLMWGTFAAAKVKAAQVAGIEKYAEGTVELLQGGSHASGHDIDLGTKPDGTKRRAEGGEYFAVINKRSSRKYRKIIPDLVKSLNNGTFVSRYTGAYDKLGDLALDVTGAPRTNLSQLESDVRRIREQNEEKRYVDPQGNVIVVYKNLTRKIKN